MALVGLLVGLFGLIAMSTPGRIDIVDGETRYESARSLVEHGDFAIRNDRIWFGVYPGRDKMRHTSYRLPQIILGAPAIVLSDATGPRSEPRRHFFFALTSAVAAATLAPLYAIWFRQRGRAPRTAVVLAVFGVLANPSWFYGTSTFDDILGTTAVVAVVVLGFLCRDRTPSMALWVGLLLGFCIHCKPPLGAFVLLGLAAICPVGAGLRDLLHRGGWFLAGVAVMGAIYVAVDRYRFPPESLEMHPIFQSMYYPPWPGHPLVALLALLFSTGTSLFLYAPTALLGLRGLGAWATKERWVVAAFIVGALAFGGFIASMSFFKGDPAWGPRYFTPLFAVLWLFAPDAVSRVTKTGFIALVTAGVLVQLLALAVEPQRLFVEHGLPNTWTAVAPQYLFDPALSHLVQRPREIAEILGSKTEVTPYSPEGLATAALPISDVMTPSAVRRYHVFASLRPWWISQRHLDPGERPVPLGMTAAIFIVMGGAGFVAAARAIRGIAG